MTECSHGWKNCTDRRTNHYQVTKHGNMPAKKTATTKKVSAKKKEVTKVVDTPVVVPETKVGKMTWANVVKTEMKKPRSWADWSARQLDDNRMD